MCDIKVLIIEDNPVIAKMMLRMFAHLGHKVDIASNGFRALQLVGLNHYRLIISDLGLSDMSGVDLIEQIRKHELLRGHEPAYICAATAYNLQEFRPKCFRVGFDEVVSKPLNIHFLNHLILKAEMQILQAS